MELHEAILNYELGPEHELLGAVVTAGKLASWPPRKIAEKINPAGAVPSRPPDRPWIDVVGPARNCNATLHFVDGTEESWTVTPDEEFVKLGQRLEDEHRRWPNRGLTLRSEPDIFFRHIRTMQVRAERAGYKEPAISTLPRPPRPP